MTQKDATDFKRKITKNTPGETPNSSFFCQLVGARR